MKLMVKPYLSVVTTGRYGNIYQDTIHKIDIKHKYYGSLWRILL